MTLADKWNEKAKAYPDWSAWLVTEEIDAEIVVENHIDSRRWFEVYETTITDGTEFAQFVHKVGSTEMQDTEGAGVCGVNAYLVVPKEVTVVRYVKP